MQWHYILTTQEEKVVEKDYFWKRLVIPWVFLLIGPYFISSYLPPSSYSAFLPTLPPTLLFLQVKF